MALALTTSQTAECLRILENAGEPIVAADLAGMLGLVGSRESKRRQVRKIVKHLRDTGSMIVATLKGGYWLTKDMEIWKDYQDKRQIDAKRILAESHKRKRELRHPEQGLLFDLQPIGYG